MYDLKLLLKIKMLQAPESHPLGVLIQSVWMGPKKTHFNKGHSQINLGVFYHTVTNPGYKTSFLSHMSILSLREVQRGLAGLAGASITRADADQGF